jgi:hypothetical protein
MTKVQPGDTILVHAGLYRPDRLNYVDPLSAPFTGSWSLSLKGTAEKPITIKGAGDGEAIFDGAGNHKLFDVMATAPPHLRRPHLPQHRYRPLRRREGSDGRRGLTVRNCRFEDVGAGVWTESADSRDFFISDNLFLGREDQMRLIGWNQAGSRAAGIYPSHQLRSFFAVKVYGPGHVIAHNAIAYFHDGICISTYGPPDADPERRASSIDIYNNDIHLSNDDFIEVRRRRPQHPRLSESRRQRRPQRLQRPAHVRRPRLLLPQPALSRSRRQRFQVQRRRPPASRLSQHVDRRADPATPYSNAHFRNNLFLGRDAPNRGVMTWANATANYSSDYNGFRPNRNVQASTTGWPRPRPDGGAGIPTGGVSPPSPSFGKRPARRPTASKSITTSSRTLPRRTSRARRYHVYHAMDLNFRLKANSKAVDAGQVLPTINDNFTGKAPDLGALELNQPEPHYGPRWITWKPF